MKFKIGDVVRRKQGYPGEGLTGTIVSIEKGFEMTAHVDLGNARISGWYFSRIELVERSEYEMDA